VYAVGGKVRKAAGKLNMKNLFLEDASDVDSKTTGDGVKVFIDYLRDRFVKGEYDRVDALYMRFHSVSRQRPSLDTLLPVSQKAFFEEGVKPVCRPYLFEPDAATIFRSVLPMYLLAVMQDIFTENRASEQAARVMAMQSANDNAQKLLEQLRLEYNKLRQQSITTELLDILGGQIR
ncbi:MAG: F0F1 ATP synthase subunit gamma, partial [Paramuribaculum sp.]|nr:F0F1 ATP synthase subunit gamma [Paramuribaculum sp.]